MEVLEINVSRGRAALPIEAELCRELGENDVALLSSPRGISAPPLRELRESHHRLAQLLSQGLKAVEVSAITGFSQSRISILKADPAFKELMEHYSQVRENAFADLQQQLSSLSADALGVLRDRLLDSPEGFSNPQLVETLKTLLDRSGYGPTSKHEVTQNHSLSPEAMQRLKAIVLEAQNGRINTQNTTTIDGEAVPIASGDLAITKCLISGPRAKTCETAPERVAGQGHDVPKASGAEIISLGQGRGPGARQGPVDLLH